jgi:V8-like Glu-specific endopeptidase
MARKNKPQHKQPAPARSWPRARRMAAVAGLAAGAALLAGTAAVPATATATTAPPMPRVSAHEMTGTGRAGTAAERAVAYWTRSRMLSARNGDRIQLTSPPASHATLRHPTGPTGRVAGTAPVQRLTGAAARAAASARAKLPPRSGSTGSGWTGNFYLPPATTTGKVFFSTTGNGQTENWVCSGSTVNSGGKDAVITAGHCVYGSLGGQVPGERWHSNWVFVPDYYNGYAPYGVWTARQLWTLTNYVNNQDEGDDIGAAVMNTNSSGQHIVNVVGGQGFSWNWAESQYVYDFGYPAEAPFNGLTLQYCNGSEFNWPYVSSTMGLDCNFTGGSSGGPWLMSFGGEFGYINGVNDFGYSSLPGEIFSAYFGNNADSLYNSVANL